LTSRRGSVERGRKASPIAALMAVVKSPTAITMDLIFLGALVLRLGDVLAIKNGEFGAKRENFKKLGIQSLQSVFEGSDRGEDLGESDED
jgi:hypothetical protein